MPLDPIYRDAHVQSAASKIPFPSLFVTVSGAHLYGFSSPDSDVDLRACHLLAPDAFLGIDAPRETLEISQTKNGLEWDIVSHDARKFFLILLKGSGYALEQVLSPLVVHSSPNHEELCELARATISRRHARHYFGFARSQWKLFTSEQPPRVKPLLYTFRILLTGIHLMRTGELNANLEEMNAQFQLLRVDELIALKRATKEKITLSDPDLSFFSAEFERLVSELGRAHNQSQLPLEPTNKSDFDSLLPRLRAETSTTAQRAIAN